MSLSQNKNIAEKFGSLLTALGDQVSTPAPVVLIDVVAKNIERMQYFADQHGVQLRPHVKTHKSVQFGKMQLEAGACGLTVGNISEAEIFAAAGCSDLFLAYPVWATGSKADRITRLLQKSQLSVGAESFAGLDQLAEAVAGSSRLLTVVIEIDCGANRSGVKPTDAGKLAAYARDRGLNPLGVFTYPGHGGSKGMQERAATDQANALRSAVVSFCDYGIEAQVVSAGSTPTARFSTDPVITEIRPGEYIFNDNDNLRLGSCDATDIGLFVASTVVSDQGHEHVMLDTGTKALAREGDPQRGYGQVPTYDGYLSRLNEYHGFLQIPKCGVRPAVG